MLGFTLLISVFTGVLFGWAPALQASKPDLNQALKEGGGRRIVGGGHQRTRSLLVISEVALALVLLIGAGLVIHSFLRLLRVEPGFKPDGVLTALIFLSGPKYVEEVPVDMKRVSPQVETFYQQVLQRLEALPGVESAGMIGQLPTRWMEARAFTIAGRPAPPPAEQPAAGYNEVSPNFFRTMGIPLLKGRALTEQDSEGSPWVVVINESMARRFWPNENPLGKQVHLQIDRGVAEDRPREIVGVVRDARHQLFREPSPVMYVSYLQHPREYPGGRANSHLRKSLVIRTSSSLSRHPMALTVAVRSAVAEVDKDQPVYDLLSMEQVLSTSVAPWRFYMQLLGLFASMALILAAVGIYGVTSYAATQRRHEMGVRMALGAQHSDIFKLVLWQGLKLTLIGIAAGLAGAWALTRFIAHVLYGVSPTDPATFVGVSLLLSAVALLASYLPARRVTKVDPMMALRYE